MRIAIAAVALMVGLLACNTSPTATPTPTPVPTSTPTATPTSTPTATPTSTSTATPTSTPTATPTSTPTATPTNTPTPATSPTPTPRAIEVYAHSSCDKAMVDNLLGPLEVPNVDIDVSYVSGTTVIEHSSIGIQCEPGWLGMITTCRMGFPSERNEDSLSILIASYEGCGDTFILTLYHINVTKIQSVLQEIIDHISYHNRW